MMSIDDDFMRINKILGKPLKHDPPAVSEKTLTAYYRHLKNNLKKGLLMEGRETLGYFQWEEVFEWGGGSAAQHRQLKKQYASVEDKLIFQKCLTIDKTLGVIASMLRLDDKRSFNIPLGDLVVSDTKHSAFQLIEDYSTWLHNF